MTEYDIIKRPIVTEKAVGKKEAENTLCFEVIPGANKSQIKSAVEHIFKVKVAGCPHRKPGWQAPPPRAFCRLSAELEKGLREAETGRKDARIRGDLTDMPL